MTVTNRYKGSITESPATDRDEGSNIVGNVNHNMQQINSDSPASISNSYIAGYNNQFGASSQFSSNEQAVASGMVRESINMNGITVKYMPRSSSHFDELWNEKPEASYHAGVDIDMLLVSAAGFEGEGDVMTQYGMEFREEVILSVSIPRFEQLYDITEHPRTRPLEGDLVVIPFGRSSTTSKYQPKIFEITRVTTYHDGAFFQLGDNFQYKLRCKLFELSGEDIDITEGELSKVDNAFVDPVGMQEVETPVNDVDGNPIVDSDGNAVTVTNLEEFIAPDPDVSTTTLTDTWGDNLAIERESQNQDILDVDGDVTVDEVPLVVEDLTAQSHSQRGIISNLDEI